MFDVQDVDPKRVRVLESAMKVVLSYGYHRTTMDDIARAAEMSRPALYLLFKNKAEIYRAVAARMFQDCIARVSAALAASGSLSERMVAAIDIMISQMNDVRCSPHGEELMDLKSELAGGLVEKWHTALSRLFRHAICREAKRLEVDLEARGLSAEVMAELLLDGLEGMKARTADVDAQRKAARQMVRVLELVLQR